MFNAERFTLGESFVVGTDSFVLGLEIQDNPTGVRHGGLVEGGSVLECAMVDMEKIRYSEATAGKSKQYVE